MKGLKSLRLAWLKRIFSENDGTWQNYLHHALKCYGGSLLFHCNYNVKDLTIFLNFIPSCFSGGRNFETSFLQRNHGTIYYGTTRTFVLDYKPMFYKTFFESGITHVTDLRFDLNVTESYNIITKKMKKVNILVWAGLRHAVPSHLISKSKPNNRTFLTMPPSLNIENSVFDIPMKKSKDYYTKLISKKAKIL